MPMTVMNNNAAAMALGELNKNTSKLAKDLQKISSGKRINSAANGASEYSVGKKMEVMIRSLGQDIINTQTGRDLIKVAEGGIQEIVDIIRNMKEMALNSANDHNTDLDRATLQKEFNQRIHEISNIAGTTNYNGRLLLNGDYAEWSWGEKEELVTEISEILVEKPIVSSTNPLVDEPTGAVTIINAGDYTISMNGIYMLAPDYQGTITVNAGNVELRSNTFNTATYINCPNGNTNLWLNGLRINNLDYRDTIDKSIIKFTGTGNTLNLVNGNHLYGQGTTTAIVNIGDELTIYKGNSSVENHYLQILDTKGRNKEDVEEDSAFYIAHNTYGALLGADANENSNGILTVSGGQIQVGGVYDSHYIKDFYDGNYIGSWGAAIGSGAFGTFGSIIVNGEGRLEGRALGLKGAAIGTGYQGILTGDIIITDNSYVIGQLNVARTGHWPSDARTRVPASAATIGCGIGGKVLGNINITGGTVFAGNIFCGAGIGTAGDDEFTSYVGGINIGNAKLSSGSVAGEAIGLGGSPSDPECNSHGYVNEDGLAGLPKSDVSTLTGSIGSVTLSDLNYSNEWDYNGEIKYHTAAREKSGDVADDVEVTLVSNNVYKKYETYQEGRPLIIHTGPKANLNLQVFINSMHPIAMGMVGISVNSRENAVKSLEKLDNALEYALKEQTKMGAYQMRLSETEENLVAAQENTTSAESVLTDADMAKEMNEFTKDNVLSQAAQAMLSQEQKNAGAVLQMLE